MRNLVAFLFILLFTSCKYFNVKKTSSQAILNEELQTFNWNDVDDYPSFSKCDSIVSKNDSALCFEQTITKAVTSFLIRQRIVVTQDVKDTIVLQVEVSNTGKLVLLESKIDVLTTQEIPDIKQLLNESLNTLPKAYPAIKRGQQVTTAFKLPIVIDVN